MNAADKERIAKLIKALKAYADESTYYQRSGPFTFLPPVEEGTEQALVLIDKGQIARNALAEIGE